MHKVTILCVRIKHEEHWYAKQKEQKYSHRNTVISLSEVDHNKNVQDTEIKPESYQYGHFERLGTFGQVEVICFVP